MDHLTAECFFESVRNMIYQATQRSLAKEELVELTQTLQLMISGGVPGDAALNRRVKVFCLSVYASGLFFGVHRRESLAPLLEESDQLRSMYARKMVPQRSTVRAPQTKTVHCHLWHQAASPTQQGSNL